MPHRCEGRESALAFLWATRKVSERQVCSSARPPPQRWSYTWLRNPGATSCPSILPPNCSPALVSPDEKRALGEDIIKNGLTSPIVLWGPTQVTGIPARRHHSARCDRDRDRLSGDLRRAEHHGGRGLPCLRQGDRARQVGRSLRLRHQRQHPSPPSHRRAEARSDREADQADPRNPIGRSRRRRRPTTRRSRAVRAEQEARGEIPHVSTRTDSKGRKQPAKRSKRKTSTPPHVLEKRAAAAERLAR